MLYGKVAGVLKPAPRLFLGTMIINSKEQERAFRLLDDAFELGFTGLDLAAVYGAGDAERTVGRWMLERNVRDRMFLLTKGAHPAAERKRVTPLDISADLRDSLARLRTDHVELYLLHRDDPDVPVGEIVDILNDHHRAGRIQAFGGSNWTHDRIRAANEWAAANGRIPFAAASPNFSLAVPSEEVWKGCLSLSGPENASARAWYREQRMPVFAWSSLGRGFLSGRLTRANYEEVKDGLDGACRRCFCNEPNFQRLDRVEILARERGLTVPQVALAYVLNKQLSIFALVGTATRDECLSNLAALDVRLEEAEMEWLNLERSDRPA